MAKAMDAKAKAKRQKIILAVLGVVFLGVLAWQVPSVLKIMNKKPPAAATTPAATPAPGAIPPAGTPAVPGTPVSATPTTQLQDSDPGAQPAGGQLVSFDRFSSKDPFVQQAGAGAPTAAPPPPAAAGGAKPTATAPPTKPAGGSKPPPPSAVAPTSAQIAVNGNSESVSVGAAFPEADPTFVLVSVTRTSAKIGISGGSLDSGSSTVTLKKGKKLTLENTVDGSRYVLLLVSTG